MFQSRLEVVKSHFHPEIAPPSPTEPQKLSQMAWMDSSYKTRITRRNWLRRSGASARILIFAAGLEKTLLALRCVTRGTKTASK